MAEQQTAPQEGVDAFERQRQTYWKSPFLRHLGLEIGELAPGRAEIRLNAGAELWNRNETVHGGVLATMVDSANLQAIRTCTGLETAVVAAEFKVSFLAPAQPGLLVARGEVVRIGGTLATAAATVRDATGEAVAIGLGTYRIFGDRKGSR